MTPPIKFYRTGDPYGEFSNFSKHRITMKDGGDGSGKNMLGRILMELRDELR